MHAALQCMTAIVACSAQPAVLVRLEGGLKACVVAMRRGQKHSAAVSLAARILSRSITVSAVAATALQKVRIHTV